MKNTLQRARFVESLQGLKELGQLRSKYDKIEIASVIIEAARVTNVFYAVRRGRRYLQHISVV
jgi:hypothetical protein